MASMSISGVVSGMDWESMIDEIISAAAKPAQVQVSKRTNLVNKKSLFEEMKVMVQSIQSSMTTLKLPSTYKAKAVDIERVDSSGSYKGVLTATVNADAEVNVYDINVKQLASAQTNRSAQITASSIASTLSSGGITDTSSKMYITAAGQRIGIDVYSTDSLQSLKSRINNTVKTLDTPLAITASVVDNRLVIKSDNTGLGSTTTESTVTYNSNGITTMQNIAVDENGTLTVRSGGTTYTEGTDYVVVNGNQIRWKQYDRSNEVSLGSSVSAKYTMAKGDIYSDTGTMGDSEAQIFGFTMTDNGTLASRVKIVDENGITYTYGKDFTITNAKVSWIEPDERTTNEPDSYTVNYSKKVTDTYSSSTSSSSLSSSAVQASYLVKDIASNNLMTWQGSQNMNSIASSKFGGYNFDSLAGEVGKLTFTDSSSNTYEYLDLYGRDDEFTFISNGKTYEYGNDYVIRKDGLGNLCIDFSAGHLSNYRTAYTNNGGTINTPTGINSRPEANDAYSISYNRKYSMDISNILNAYEDNLGSEIETVTLTDSDGVIRTYLDLAGKDDVLSLTATDGTNTNVYQYGRDYVIRVSDDGTGYNISWLVDNGKTIANANADAAAYTQYKNISTLGLQTSPELNYEYTLTYSYDHEVKGTAEIKSSDKQTDAKNVTSLFDDITLTEADYSDSITITDGSTTYIYGKDYTIDSSGNIEWLTITPSKPSDADTTIYSVTSQDYTSETISASITKNKPSDSVVKINVDGNYLSWNQLNAIDDKSVFSVTDSDGNIYEYGTDFTFAKNSGSETEGFTIKWKSTDKTKAMDDDATYTINYKKYDSITDSDGNSYSWGKDFTVNDDGTAHWLLDDVSVNPEEGTSYTLTYQAFEALEAKLTYVDGTTETKISDFSGAELTYSNILSDVNVSSKPKSKETEDEYQERVDNALEKVFSLTDGTTTYEYATDYRITENDDGDLIISWLGGDTPADDAKLTLTYTGKGEGGGEVMNMPYSVTRSNTDTIRLSASTAGMPTYENFSDAEIRITDGNETFFLDTDFTLSQDSNGMAVINWIDTTTIPPAYANNFDKASSISVYDSEGNSITGFSIEEDEDGNAVFFMDDGSTLDDGDYTVKVTKNGHTKVYDLISENGATVLVGHSAWQSQDVSKAGSYSIYVTKDNVRTEYKAARAKDSYDFKIQTPAATLGEGTNTITQGTKTFYEGVDFNIGTDDDGNPAVVWIPDSEGGYEWYYPATSSTYTINHTDLNGNTSTFTAVRNKTDSLNLLDYGITKAGGTLSVQYGDDELYYNLEAEDEEGNTGNDVLRATHSFTIDKRSVWSGEVDENNQDIRSYEYIFNWQTPTLTSRTNLPAYNSEIELEYEYDANTFTLSDDGDGLIDALGLNENVTEAHNAIIELDGEEVQRDMNNIGADYGNELIKGMTIQLKGVGEVSLDVYHDAEKAIDAITTFKDGYNDLMTWMNTRMTESQVDEDTAATIDSDDFRMRWGLLHGNSLLRQTKSQMRDLTAQSFTFSFTQNTSDEEIYGTMANNGLRNNATLRLRIAGVYSDITILPTYTLQDVVDMINDKNNPEMRNIYYDETGHEREQPLLKASINDDKLTISSTSSDTITMSGSSAMKALKMNYTYTGLFQIGLATTSTDYGKSGELEFDESKFMDALEDNADEVQELMLMYANQMDTWLKSMLNSSASGQTSGTLTRQIEDLETQISSIDEYLEKYQDRLDRQEEALRTKFAAAEQNISKLSQQASSIAAILNQLNGYTSSSNSSD